MATRIIHLINPKTDSLTTRPIYLNRALYSPLAGLLAVAACVLDRRSFPAARQSASDAMADLQPLHAQGLANREHRFDRDADR